MCKTKKVCLFTISLAQGGAEKFVGILSKLIENQDYEVHIVSMIDDIEYSYSGKLFNFGSIKGNSAFTKIKAFIKLRKYLKDNEFNYIIDNRPHQFIMKELFYLFYMFRGFSFIYVIHSNNLSTYFPSLKLVGRLMIKKAAKIICVSKSIEESIRLKFSINNLQTIYNPIEYVDSILGSTIDDNRYILFLGRFEDRVKNLTLLLNGYNSSKLRNKVKIKMFGEGKDKRMIQNKIEDLGVADFVKMYPFTNDTAKLIINARFSVLTSRFEGFPMSLIESLALGAPVVSVNYRGVEEIVKHEVNGLLVENHNPLALAKAMERMFYDEELYIRCKNNAKQSVDHLRSEEIGLQWKTLLQSLK